MEYSQTMRRAEYSMAMPSLNPYSNGILTDSVVIAYGIYRGIMS